MGGTIPIHNFLADTLTAVSGGTTTASFSYDGDGNRVQGTVNGVTITYIGNYFEWTGSTGTKKRYYYAGTTRLAMRVGNGTGGQRQDWRDLQPGL